MSATADTLPEADPGRYPGYGVRALFFSFGRTFFGNVRSTMIRTTQRGARATIVTPLMVFIPWTMAVTESVLAVHVVGP